MTDDRCSSSPEHWVDEYGDYLYRYALTRLRDHSRAEEAVQETFLAAWKNRDTFSEHSAVRTWLTGILKHKVVDQIRKHAREANLYTSDGEVESLEDLFDRRGYAKSPARSWQGDPAKDLERDEFWACFQSCLSKLPPKLSHAFVMREMDGMDRDEICKVLDITPTNYWVMLHRARLQLRGCLEKNWFLQDSGGDD